MPNPNYRMGRAFEYRVMKKLREEHPKSYIFRSAGSHGHADIIQVFPKGEGGGVYLYQLKIKPTKKEMQELETLRRKTGLFWILVVPAARGTKSVYDIVDTYHSLDPTIRRKKKEK